MEDEQTARPPAAARTSTAAIADARPAYIQERSAFAKCGIETWEAAQLYKQVHGTSASDRELNE
jgi:hypothetical protein